MKLEDMFQSIHDRLLADLKEARASVDHAASKGAINEEAVRVLLKSRLPRTVEISNGILIDSHGKMSRQLDIIIHDAAKTPVLFEQDGFRVIPVECAYAVIEVKTALTLTEVESSWKNMESAKELKKTAFYPDGVIIHDTTAYGKEYKDWPLMYFVFAFESAGLQAVSSKLKILSEGTAIDKRIDMIFSLQHGLLANRSPVGTIDALPSAGTSHAVSAQNSLLLFYVLLSQYLNQVYMRKFRFSDYVKAINWPMKIL